jgi:hypothetical protein
MAKGVRLDIRLTDDEKDDLYQRAEYLDMRPTEYARMLLFPVEVDAPVVQVKPSVAPVVKPKVIPPRSVGLVVKLDRIYTGETVSKFGRVMREYVAEDGSKRWE